MQRTHAKTGVRSGFLCALLALTAAPAATAQEEVSDFEALRRQVEALMEKNREMDATIQRLEGEVGDARAEARAAQDLATPGAGLPLEVSAASQGEDALFSVPLGRANLQLLDISLDILTSSGWSTAPDSVLQDLQGGDHDPRKRGFTLQAVELSFAAAVDPYFDAEAHLVYNIDSEGESSFEIEEAFGTSRMLPFGLEERGLELEVGQFYTEFGRQNPRHAHSWQWLDQPVVLSRFFGEDGIRNPGARVGWLAPLPWYSQIDVGLQNSNGETMVSFLANQEVFDERPIGGRPFADVGVGSANDLVKLARWVNAFDLSDTTSTQLGFSFLHGPNATGDGGETFVYGGDLVAKWRPLRTDRGWPFVVFESEFLYREYQADDFAEFDLSDETLRDWGGYAQLLWGFVRGWSAGLRAEYASGEDPNVECDADAGSCARVSRATDPFRSRRLRLSPLLSFRPTDFSSIRLQYNYDQLKQAAFSGEGDAHSVWLGFEFSIGSHAAHAY